MRPKSSLCRKFPVFQSIVIYPTRRARRPPPAPCRRLLAIPTVDVPGHCGPRDAHRRPVARFTQSPTKRWPRSGQHGVCRFASDCDPGRRDPRDTRRRPSRHLGSPPPCSGLVYGRWTPAGNQPRLAIPATVVLELPSAGHRGIRSPRPARRSIRPDSSKCRPATLTESPPAATIF